MTVDGPRFRQLIGHFATGVTVITTAVGTRLHGMTANAVCSLSLEPLMLLVCVDKAANMHAEIQRAGRFAVNILAEDQEDISRAFASSAEPEENRLRGFPYHLGPEGVPILDGILAYIACDVVDQVDGGDHTICFGSVIEGEVVGEGTPLIFYRGGYRQLGD